MRKEALLRKNLSSYCHIAMVLDLGDAFIAKVWTLRLCSVVAFVLKVALEVFLLVLIDDLHDVLR